MNGGGDTVNLSGDPSNAASLYNTAGVWDTVKGSKGWIGLTKAQASVTGGGDTINSLRRPQQRREPLQHRRRLGHGQRPPMGGLA